MFKSKSNQIIKEKVVRRLKGLETETTLKPINMSILLEGAYMCAYCDQVHFSKNAAYNCYCRA